jgi:hypothetical protein
MASRRRHRPWPWCSPAVTLVVSGNARAGRPIPPEIRHKGTPLRTPSVAQEHIDVPLTFPAPSLPPGGGASNMSEISRGLSKLRTGIMK